jgi:histidinol-phosphate aminotransferase
MFNLESIVRKNILSLKPYSSARDEFSGRDGIFLDANENPFGELNRYPDPYQKELKQKLSKLKNVPAENIFIGNGSDEVIDLTFRIFCEPGQDNVIICPPTYGMYEVSANINNVAIKKVNLKPETFQLDTDQIITAIDDKTKLIFVCCPNNPTGNGVKWLDIKRILESFNGIVVVDEAYIDFASYNSLIPQLPNYSNLLIMQTFSKAWGLAGARVGIAYADAKIISLFNKVKPPYNVSEINQKAALKALDNVTEFEKRKQIILKEKKLIIKELNKSPKVKYVYPSEANFLLIEVDNADKVYNDLVGKKVITRNRHSLVKNCIRITVGSPEENQKLIDALNNL